MRCMATEHGRLVRYKIVLLVEDGGERKTVRLFDNCHGIHEMHRYTRDGTKRPAERFHHGTVQEAMDAALEWVHTSGGEMIAAWKASS